MNPEKHKKDLVQAWMRGEELPTPTNARNLHLLSTYVKIGRPSVGRRSKRAIPSPPVNAPPDPASMREPGPIPTIEEHHLPRASWDHLQKLKHLGRMRASFEYIAIQHPPTEPVRLAPSAARRDLPRPPFPRKPRTGGRRLES